MADPFKFFGPNLSSQITQARYIPSPRGHQHLPKLKSSVSNGETECQSQSPWTILLPKPRHPRLYGGQCFPSQRLTYLGPAQVEIIFENVLKPSLLFSNPASPLATFIRKHQLRCLPQTLRLIKPLYLRLWIRVHIAPILLPLRPQSSSGRSMDQFPLVLVGSCLEIVHIRKLTPFHRPQW